MNAQPQAPLSSSLTLPPISRSDQLNLCTNGGAPFPSFDTTSRLLVVVFFPSHLDVFSARLRCSTFRIKRCILRHRQQLVFARVRRHGEGDESGTLCCVSANHRWNQGIYKPRPNTGITSSTSIMVYYPCLYVQQTLEIGTKQRYLN